MEKRDYYVIWLMLISARIIFIFSDWFFSSQEFIDNGVNPTSKQTTSEETQYIYPEEETHPVSDVTISLTDSTAATPQDITAIKTEKIKKISDNTSSIEDIKILEAMYKETRSDKVLDMLVEKLVSDYQFEKAYNYINPETNPDSQFNNYSLYLYILLNWPSINITKGSSITNFQSKLEQFKSEWKITKGDYYFYQWLIALRYQDFTSADELLSKVTEPNYMDMVSKIRWSISQLHTQKDMPAYYQEWLIWVTLLKKWYFSVAQKIALDVLLKDDTYILPYQLLAYSNFLTNNDGKAIDYFLKLMELDKDNENNYKFLIWVSYYRLEKYEQSVIYLSQIKDSDFAGDVDRYLLLNYIKWWDEQKQIDMRQKLLWQQELIKSDFFLFFYNVFFDPFANWWSHKTYGDNIELANMWISKCWEIMTENDRTVCTYGEAWLNIVNWQREQAKPKLDELVKIYNQSYLFHAIWDYYYQIWDKTNAKEYYIKATSMTDNKKEEKILKSRMMDFDTTTATMLN